MESIFNFDNSISFLKNKFGKDYCSFAKNFTKYKFRNGNNLFDYIKIDNYAIINLSTIYDYNHYIQWLNSNNLIAKEYDIDFFLKKFHTD